MEHPGSLESVSIGYSVEKPGCVTSGWILDCLVLGQEGLVSTGWMVVRKQKSCSIRLAIRKQGLLLARPHSVGVREGEQQVLA